MRHLLATMTLVLGLSFPDLAQAPPTPDFSGTWVLNLAKSTVTKDNTIQSDMIVIDYKKSKIIFHHKTDGKKSTETYIVDGQSHVAADMSSGQLISKANWQDSKLVIESTLQIRVPNVAVSVSGLKPIVDRWTLAPDGRALSHEAADGKQVFVYDKQ